MTNAVWKRSQNALDYGSQLLENADVKLRETTAEDLETLAAWWNDPAYAPLQQIVTKPRPAGGLVEMFQEWSLNQPNSGNAGFSVVSAEDGELCGHVTLYGAALPARAAEFAIMIAPKFTGRGLGSAATALMLRYAFEELGLNRVGLKVWSYNDRAIRAYERAGFKKEGARRQAVFHAGRFHDEVLMSVLAEDYFGNVS